MNDPWLMFLPVAIYPLDTQTARNVSRAGGLNTDFAARHPNVGEGLDAQLHLLWPGSGHQDKLLEINQELVDGLRGKVVHLTWVPIPGQHTLRVWRRDLAQLASLLFQD